MPSRLVCVAILSTGASPRSACSRCDDPARAEPGLPPRPAHDRPGRRRSRPVALEHPGHRRPGASRGPAVGRRGRDRVETARRTAWFELTSRVGFDAGRPAPGDAASRPRATSSSRSRSTYQVDPSGNLRSFDVEVRLRGRSSGELFTVDGPAQARGMMEVVVAGARADPEPEAELPVPAPERGAERARAARPAAGPAGRPALGQPGGQPVHRPGRAGAGRGRSARR